MRGIIYVWESIDAKFVRHVGLVKSKVDFEELDEKWSYRNTAFLVSRPYASYP